MSALQILLPVSKGTAQPQYDVTISVDFISGLRLSLFFLSYTDSSTAPLPRDHSSIVLELILYGTIMSVVVGS